MLALEIVMVARKCNYTRLIWPMMLDQSSVFTLNGSGCAKFDFYYIQVCNKNMELSRVQTTKQFCFHNL